VTAQSFTVSASGTTGGVNPGTGSLTVSKRTVTPTVTLNNKTYDGTTAATTVATRSLSGVVNSDDVNLGTSGTVAAYTSRNVGSYTPSVTSLALSGTTAGNYVLSATTVSPSSSITARALTVTAAATSKTYDGTTGAATAPTITTGAVQTGDTANFTETYSTKDVGASKTLTPAGTVTDGNSGNNYTYSFVTANTGTITTKALTAQGNLALSSKVYDGTTGATPTGAAALQATETAGTGSTTDGKPYSVDSVGLTGTAAYAFNSKDVTSATTVTESGLSLTGTGSGNYTLTAPTLSATITPKPLTVSGITAASTIYDGTTTAKLGGTAAFQSVEAAGTGTTSDGMPYNVDSVSPGTVTGTLAAKDVGTQNVTTSIAVTGTGSGNYTVTPQAGLTQTVTAKALAVSGITAASTIYDGTTTAKLGGTAAFLATEAAGTGTTADGKPYSVDAVSPGTVAGTLAAKDVGSQAVTTVVAVTGSGNGNYTVTPQAGLTQNVTAKTLTAVGTLVFPASKVYDATTTATLTSGSAALQTAETAGPGTTADGKPYTVDTVSLTGTASYAYNTKDVATATGVIASGLSLTGANSGNYTLTAPSLAATITAKALTLSGLTASAKIYDGTTTATLTGTAAFPATEAAGTGTTGDGMPYNVDSVSPANTTSGTFASKDVANGIGVTTAATVTGTGASNYSVTQQPGLTANITPKALTAQGTLALSSKVYDGTTGAAPTGAAALQATETAGTGTSSDGKPYGVDSVSLTGTAIYTFNSKDVATATTVTESGLSLTGTGNGNYTLTPPTLSAPITPKALTAVGTLVFPASKVYDATTTATLTSGSAALQTAETAGAGTTADGKPYTVDTVSLTGTASYAYNTKDVATATTVTASGLSLTGTDIGNYTLTAPSFSKTITAKALTMSGLSVPTSKVYNGTTAAVVSGSPGSLQSAEAAGTGTATDGQPYTGDTVSLTGTATGTYNSKDVATAATVTFGGLSLTGAQAGDYTLTIQSAASATITTKALTAQGTLALSSKVYNGTTSASPTGAAALQPTETAGAGATSDGKPYSVDAVSLTGTATYTFNAKDVATATTVTESGLSLTGTGNGNYTLTPPTLSATITAKALTMSGLSVPASKAYDGTTTAVVSGSPGSLQTAETAGTGTTADGKPYSVDSVSLTGTATGTYNSASVASATTVTFGGVSLTGTGSGNYTLTIQSPAAATITALPVILSGSRTYDGSTVAAAADLTVANNVDGGNLTLSGSGVLSSKDVGSRAVTAPQAPVRVNSATGVSVNNQASFNVTVTAPADGNTLIAVISTRSTTANAVSSISQTGASWSRAASTTGTAGVTTEIWYAPNISGAATTVTINVSGGSGFDSTAVVAQYDGILSASALDKTATSTGTNTAAFTGATATTTQANELWIGGIGLADNVSFSSPTNSFTSFANVNSGGSSTRSTIYALERIVTATGAAASGGTVSATAQWAGAMATFKAEFPSGTPLTLGGSAAGCYTLTGMSGSMTVTAKALTVSGITAASTIYDGTTTAKLGGTAAFLSTEAAGTGTTADGKPYSVDSVSPGTVTGTLAVKNVGSEAVTTSVAVTGTGSGNYTVTPQAGLTQTVTAKALTVSGITAASTIYDGTTTAKLGGTAAFQTAEAAGAGTTSDGKPYSVDSVSTGGTAAGTLAAKDVGTRAVTITGVTVTGTGSGNYTVTQQTGLTQAITAKALTVSGITAANTIYDGTTTAKLGGTAAFQTAETAAVGTSGDGKPYTGNGDSVSISGTATGTLASKDVGTRAVTISGNTVTGTGSGNYTVTQQTGLTQTITAKALTVSGITAASTIYDGTTSAKLGGTAAFQTAEAAAVGTSGDGKPYTGNGDSVSPGTVTGTLAAKDVGTQNVTTSVAVTGTGSGNYTVTPQAGLTQTVTQKALTVSGITAASTTYDGTTTAKLGGTAAFQAPEAAAVGTGGDGKPYTGNGDSVSIGGTAAGTLAAKDVGTQSVTITGNTVTGTGSGNYTVAQQTGLAQTVTAKALTITGLTASARVYDGTTVEPLGGTAALLGTESAGDGSIADGKPYSVDSVSAGGTAVGAFADRNVGTAKSVTVSGVTITGTGSGNYTPTQQTGLTADITAKALTITGLTASARVYDGTTVEPLGGTAALLGTESAGAGSIGDGKPYSVDSVSAGGTVVGAFADRNVGGTKSVTVSGVTITGTGSSNYTPTQPTGLTADITAKALTITGLTASARVYDGTTVEPLGGTAALLGTESAGAGSIGDGKPYSVDSVSAGGTAVGAFADRNVGAAKSVTVSGVTITGTGSGNYTPAQQTGLTADITAKALTVSGLSVPASKVYDATTTATVSGTPALQAAEAVGSGTTSDGIPYDVDAVRLTGTPTGSYDSPNVATATTVTFSGLSLTGTDNSNYSLTAPTQAATIIQANSSGALSSSANPSPPGSNVTVTATLTPLPPGGGTPAGTVQFIVDGSSYGTPVALSSGVASLTTSSLSHGYHTIAAAYAGDSNFHGSTNSLGTNQLINTSPVAANTTLGAFENRAVNLSGGKLLIRCSDADHDALSLAAVDAASTQGGSVSLSGTTITYTPPANYVGADDFTYQVSDTYGATANATISVTVKAADVSSVITGITSQPGGSMEVKSFGIPGVTYLIQASTDLSTWTTISTNVASSTGVILFLDTDAPNHSSRFYRVAAP
jgi:hypothetical protein